MAKKVIGLLEEKVLSGEAITYDEARELMALTGSAIFALLVAANAIKEHYVGDTVHLCSIVNAKSGKCPEDCGFCAQSAHHKTDVPVYSLISADEIVNSAKLAEENDSSCFGIVTSGRTVNEAGEFDAICDATRRIREETGVNPSASLGIITYEQALKLKEAGLVKYHHNIESSENFYKNVCTTRSYEDNLNTIRSVKRAGLKICSGVIFGLGEAASDRLDMAFTLSELDVDSVPINFLNPIKNTRFEANEPLSPLELLKSVALMRFIMPDKKISICGGREQNLRDLQSYMFLAGANGTMAGNYLTTQGRSKAEDVRMIHDLGLRVE